MELLGFLLALVFIAIFGLKFAVQFQRTSDIDSQKKNVSTGVEVGHYRPRYSLLTKSEMAFFEELNKQLPGGYYAFPKMRIADILETTEKGRDYYRVRNKILPKHIDFVVCNQYFKPLIAIEVNGSSHRKANVQASDALKREIFEVAGLPLVTVPVGTSFASAVDKLLRIISV